MLRSVGRNYENTAPRVAARQQAAKNDSMMGFRVYFRDLAFEVFSLLVFF
jgi:hypothetical protein